MRTSFRSPLIKNIKKRGRVLKKTLWSKLDCNGYSCAGVNLIDSHRHVHQSKTFVNDTIKISPVNAWKGNHQLASSHERRYFS